MDISSVLRTECIWIGSSEEDKKGLLRKVAKGAKRCSALDHLSERTILEALTAREKISTTALTDGIAIPHCRMKSVQEFVLGILVFPDGVDFEAQDGQKTHLMFFIIAPEHRTDDHIKLLSLICRALLTSTAKEEMLQQSTAVGVKEAFLRHVAAEMEPAATSEKSLVYVFVQDEDKFADILETLASVSPSAFSVIECSDISRFLYKLPLFSAFWSGHADRFNRLITGIVNKPLVNELVRSIDMIAGGLDQNPGILFIAQDIFFTAGSLKS